MNTGATSKGIQASLMDIFEGTYSDVYMEIFSDGFIQGYWERYNSGEIQVDFPSYLNGIIRHKVFENAEKSKVITWRRLSEKEIFDRIIDSKKKETKQRHIALAKARYGERVRGYLLGEFSEPLKSVIDYFFERFCLEKYHEIRPTISQQGSTLVSILKAFTPDDYQKGLSFSGSVAPLNEPLQIFLTENSEEGFSEDELLSRISQHDDDSPRPMSSEEWRVQRVRFWDQMIQGVDLNLESVRQHVYESVPTSSERQDKEGAILCLTCASVLNTGTPATKRNLRIFLVHHFSKCGHEKPLLSNPVPATLTLADIEGTRLSWQEASRIFVNKEDYSAHARIKATVSEAFSETWQQVIGSDYT